MCSKSDTEEEKERYSPKVRTILDQLGERLHRNPRVSNLRFRQCPKLLAATLSKRRYVGPLAGCGLGAIELTMVVVGLRRLECWNYG